MGAGTVLLTGDLSMADGHVHFLPFPNIKIVN